MARPFHDSTNGAVLGQVAGIAGIVYVVLYFVGNFATGVGEQFAGNHPSAAVVTWTTQHEGLVRFAVFNDLVIDLMFVLFVLLLVALSGGRSIPALVAYVGVGLSTAVFIVVLGLQLSIRSWLSCPTAMRSHRPLSSSSGRWRDRCGRAAPSSAGGSRLHDDEEQNAARRLRRGAGGPVCNPCDRDACRRDRGAGDRLSCLHRLRRRCIRPQALDCDQHRAPRLAQQDRPA